MSEQKKALFITLTDQEVSDIAGWVNYYKDHPNETPTKLVLADQSRARFNEIARQFGVDVAVWRVSRNRVDVGPYTGPVNPTALTDDDWRVFSQNPTLWNGYDVFDRDPKPNLPQDAGKMGMTVDMDAYVAKGGAFARWFVKQ